MFKNKMIIWIKIKKLRNHNLYLYPKYHGFPMFLRIFYEDNRGINLQNENSKNKNNIIKLLKQSYNIIPSTTILKLMSFDHLN